MRVAESAPIILAALVASIGILLPNTSVSAIGPTLNSTFLGALCALLRGLDPPGDQVPKMGLLLPAERCCFPSRTDERDAFKAGGRGEGAVRSRWKEFGKCPCDRFFGDS